MCYDFSITCLLVGFLAGGGSAEPTTASQISPPMRVVGHLGHSVDPTHTARQARTFMVLHDFTGGADGAAPWGGLISDSAGNMYGTAQGGGSIGDGVVYKIDSAGNFSVIHSFTGQPSDASDPWAALVADSSGNLYGTTLYGGLANTGAVFKIDVTGKESVLYSFCSLPNCADGKWPSSPLVVDPKGNLYGMTQFGGSACNCGVVFKVNTTGVETVLHAFAGPPDGESPFGEGLVRDSTGTLYGTTFLGGSGGGGCPFASIQCGTVFSLSPSGVEVILHSFAGGVDGAEPIGTPLRDSAGNLYGTTISGPSGPSGGDGTVFKLDARNKKTLLFNFTGANGRQPHMQLFRDSAGHLYGATKYGGAYDRGTVFELNASVPVPIIILHSFTGGADGSFPITDLIRDASGTFYGTTLYGGKYGSGVVFALKP